jgi:ketopantoate reductase
MKVESGVMKKTVVIIGIGEIGGVFARGLLRSGHTVVPVNRNDDINQIAEQTPNPEAVLLTVAENDLHPALENIPPAWRDRLCLVQNELLPRDWQQHELNAPTVISVWFEKKPGMDAKPIIASPVFGPHADLLCEALDALSIPVDKLNSAEELVFELVRKNLYILTTNIAGLVAGGNVSELWQNHRTLAIEVAEDVLHLQTWLTDEKLDNKPLIAAMLVAFDGDPQHGCTGRSAPARLTRALQLADEAGLDVPTLHRIQSEQ